LGRGIETVAVVHCALDGTHIGKPGRAPGFLTVANGIGVVGNFKAVQFAHSGQSQCHEMHRFIQILMTVGLFVTRVELIS
jgi:hypothetical protein